jgi:hypothetical protein
MSPANGSAARKSLSKHSIGGLPIGWTLYRTVSSICLVLAMFTELQHLDTILATPTDSNECRKLFLGNDGREPQGFLLVFTQQNTGSVLDECLRKCGMKGIIAVVLGTMGYIMVGVALAGMG